jgi:hypothetical protein
MMAAYLGMEWTNQFFNDYRVYRDTVAAKKAVMAYKLDIERV